MRLIALPDSGLCLLLLNTTLMLLEYRPPPQSRVLEMLPQHPPHPRGDLQLGKAITAVLFPLMVIGLPGNESVSQFWPGGRKIPIELRMWMPVLLPIPFCLTSEVVTGFDYQSNSSDTIGFILILHLLILQRDTRQAHWVYGFVMSSGGSGATQVDWLLGPRDPPGARTGRSGARMHLTGVSALFIGGQLTALCAGAAPQMGDFKADKAAISFQHKAFFSSCTW